MASSGTQLSKDFYDLVKAIGESRSKQEEDKIIQNEIRFLRQNMGAKDVPSKRMREFLIRMIYVEMLGHDATFGHFQAIQVRPFDLLFSSFCTIFHRLLTSH